MNSATAAIAAPIHVSVRRSLLAMDGLMVVDAPAEPSLTDTALGVTIAAAMFDEASVVAVTSGSAPTSATRNRMVIGVLVSARVTLFAYMRLVSFGCHYVSDWYIVDTRG